MRTVLIETCSVACLTKKKKTDKDEENRVTNLDYRLGYLFNLTGLDHALWLCAQAGQLGLVGLYPSLQVRDVVPVELLPAVKQLAHTDERVSLALEVLEDALVPAAALVFQQRLASPEVLAHGDQSVIEQRDFVGVCGIGVCGCFRQRRERHGDAGVVGGHAFGSLDEPVHNVAHVDVQLSRAADTGSRTAE